MPRPPAAVVGHGRVKVDTAGEAVALQRAEKTHNSLHVQAERFSLLCLAGCRVVLPQPREHGLRSVLVSGKKEGVTQKGKRESPKKSSLSSEGCDRTRVNHVSSGSGYLVELPNGPI